jgi:uncharacterized protein (TIGR01370 family)
MGRKLIIKRLQQGFGVQYWGEGYSPDTLEAARHGLLIIEATKGVRLGGAGEVRFSGDEIRRMRRGGERPVLGYLNLTEIETYRDYWVNASPLEKAGGKDAQFYPDWYAAVTSSGERLAAYWRPEWENIVMQRLAAMLELGLDGVFLDDLLHYYTWASGETVQRLEHAPLEDEPKDASGFAKALMHLVARLRAGANTHRCDFLIVVNNGVFVGRDGNDTEAFAHYRNALDAILVESFLEPMPQHQAITAVNEDFSAHGVPVLSIDFVSSARAGSSAITRDRVAASAAKVGFLPYVADDQTFDRLYPPIIRRPALAKCACSPLPCGSRATSIA